MARTATRLEDTGAAIDALLRLASRPGAASPTALSDAKQARDVGAAVPGAGRVRYDDAPVNPTALRHSESVGVGP